MNKKIIFVLFILLTTFISGASALLSDGEYYYLLGTTDASYLPSTIYANDTVTMALDVENRGAYYLVTDLNATIDLGNEFEGTVTTSNISLIQPSSTKTLIFKFNVKGDTLPGYYPATVTFNYISSGYPYNGASNTRTEVRTFLIPVSKTEKNIDISVSPSVINPSNQTELSFSLTNSGGNPVSNISLSWSESNGLILPVGSDNKKYINTLLPSETATVKYIVAADPNITTGVYPLDVTLSFMDINGLRTQTSQVGLIVGGKTDFEVSAETQSSGQVSISLANIGSNNANAVVVKIPDQQGIKVNGSNISILGNLNKGDFTLANFQVQTTTIQTPADIPAGTGFTGRRGADMNESPGAQKTIIIQVDYTDTTGERQSVQKIVSLAQTTSTDTTGTATAYGSFAGRQRTTNNSLTAWVILGIILAVGIGVTYKLKKNWKSLAKRIVAIVIVFLIGIYMFNSSTEAVIVCTIISVALLAHFFRSEIKKIFGRKKK